MSRYTTRSVSIINLSCSIPTNAQQRPFEAHNHDKLEKEILKGTPNYPVTQPPVSMPCLHAIRSLLEKDPKKRIGAVSFESFTDNPFFRSIDFVALEQKKIPPIFVPSSEKTNFDATYDLEELLLEEAPLEARARRQKPRAQLKGDATDKEIRDEELHRMIETLFEPFDYTHAPYDPLVSLQSCWSHLLTLINLVQLLANRPSPLRLHIKGTLQRRGQIKVQKRRSSHHNRLHRHQTALLHFTVREARRFQTYQPHPIPSISLMPRLRSQA